MNVFTGVTVSSIERLSELEEILKITYPKHEGILAESPGLGSACISVSVAARNRWHTPSGSLKSDYLQNVGRLYKNQ